MVRAISNIITEILINIFFVSFIPDLSNSTNCEIQFLSPSHFSFLNFSNYSIENDINWYDKIINRETIIEGCKCKKLMSRNFQKWVFAKKKNIHSSKKICLNSPFWILFRKLVIYQTNEKNEFLINIGVSNFKISF